ncbi:MAG: hypothetical protein ACREFJ_10825 [Acetobacteraceae bacterium]
MALHGSFRIYRNGVLFCARNNLVVNAALVAAANLTADVSPAANACTAMGFGNGTTAPAVTDTGLSGGSIYFNALTGHSFPSAGSVTFTFALTSSDTGANGLDITEIGLFGNSASHGLPTTTALTPMWTHALVPAFSFSDTGANYSGTYTLTY